MNDLTKTSRTPRWFLAVLTVGMLLFAFYASTHMVAAGDTWVAMACGRHFAHHGVDTVDPFSFNSHKAGPSDEALTKAGWPEWTHGIIKKIHPTGWINQNWLTHLGYYKLATWFGSKDGYAWDALVYWKFAIYFITVLVVFGIGRVLGVPPLLAAAAACLAMVVGRTFYDIRPAGYSNMLVPAFILILALTMCRNYRWVWLIVPMIVFWANVHGGYIYAFIMLVPFVGINLLLKLDRRWTLSLGFIGLWAVLYLMSHQFVTHEHYLTVKRLLTGQELQPEALIGNKMFWILAVLSVISVVTAALRSVPKGIFYGYHFAACGLWFVSMLVRFSIGHPQNLTDYFDRVFSYFVSSSLLSFIVVFLVGTLLIGAMTFKKAVFHGQSWRGIFHTVGAGAVALVAMVIFNPFHLTNLTHTFEISVSKHAESWRQVNEWKPAFDFMDPTTNNPNPVGQEGWFGFMFVLAIVVFIVWLVGYFMKPNPQKASGKRGRRQPQPPITTVEGGYTWPKINLALIVVSFLTIYMAIRSRRFIAIAGAAAAPIIALLLYHAWQMISAKIRFNQRGDLTDQKIPPQVLTVIRAAVTVVFLVLAVFWGLKYKRIYMNPWPTDPKYNSVFMRMTASHLKPIEACEFIRLNKLSGRVFNYWTEGGAVALGQDPDPVTGEIPLKLFMDGRAQAAYNHDKFKLWQTIYSGGPIAQEAKLRGRKLTKDDLHQIANWITGQLEDRRVWVVLMPVTQSEETFMRALKSSPTWKTAYLDDIQQMLVNIDTEKGKTLIDQIIKGQALFPDPYTKDLTTFTAITENELRNRYGGLYALAKEAFDLNPSRLSAITMIQLRGSPTAREDISHYVDDFVENKDTYRHEAGYLQWLKTAILCSQFLARVDTEQKAQYRTWMDEFIAEAKTIESRQVW